jgi:MIP family channel proteins
MLFMKRQCLAEAIGTFCLVFMGTGAIVVNEITGGQITHVGISLAFGLVVLAMIYAVGHISGAHLNPAVTLGFFSAGRLEGRLVLPYLISQLTGAVLASVVLRGMFPGTSLGMTFPAGGLGSAFILEFILTAILMFVIQNVATGSREVGILAGVAIGATITLEALVGGPISGASMNPARSFGPALVSGNFTAHWIYWLAPILGSYTGSCLYRFIQPRHYA